MAKTGFVLHPLQLAFELPWMMLKRLKSLMEVCYYFLYSKKYECLFLYLLKKKKKLRLFLSLLKKKNWMSWILGIFMVLFYKWLFGFLFIYFFSSLFVCRTCEWCCINIEMSHVHTNTDWSWWLIIALWMGGIDDDLLGFVGFYFDNILMRGLEILICGLFVIRH